MINCLFENSCEARLRCIYKREESQQCSGRAHLDARRPLFALQIALDAIKQMTSFLASSQWRGRGAKQAIIANMRQSYQVKDR